MSAENHLDILSSRDINQECVINLTKQNIDTIELELQKKCKILKFSSDWSFEDVVAKIPTLDVKVYPQLFIFVIDIIANDFCSSVKFLGSSLFNFSESRPIILQLKSSKENLTKIYYKDEDCKEFSEINGEAADVTDFNDFSSFLWLHLNGKIDNFEDVMLKKLPKIKNSSLILRFMRCMKLPGDFLNKIIFKCAAYGSVFDLLAAINGFLDDEGRVKDPELILSTKIYSKSILYTSVRKFNRNNLKFLLENCCTFIQQLSFDHQLEISTAAFASSQLDVLCDLLESCDFPFPEDFDSESIINERLRKIVDDRIQFHEDVQAENRSKIKKFIKNHPNNKFALNLENKSAIGLALKSKTFKSFALLKANRFRDNEFEDINIENFPEEEAKKSAKKYAFVQTKENVNILNFDEDLSVLQLAMRSLIYNRDEINPLEQEQREFIKKWYREIYKTEYGSKLIDAAAQCKDLKIIFDFECESTENVDVSTTSGSLGVTFPVSKWIFVGAKLTESKQREQKIKGVIAHEICHYVMRLVYQNSENPYYGDDGVSRDKFEGVVNEIELMLFPKHEQDEDHESNDEEQTIEKEDDSENEESPEAVDDKCYGIISTVYTLYPKIDWHPELIVRPAHIQAQFDDDEEKTKKLEEIYKNLFEFFEQFVLPEIKNFCLQKRGNIQIFNDFIGIICELKNSSIKLQTKSDFSELLSNKTAIITSNMPKLLLLDIYSHVAEKYDELLDVKNIFIAPENLEKSTVSKKFDDILKQKQNLNIFVDCTKECGTNLEINSVEDLKLFFITSNDNKNEKAVSEIMKQSINPAKIAINYNWMDLTAESQNLLLQTKINFQNNSTFLLSELILNEIDPKQPESILNEDLKDIIDDHLLNLLVEKSEIKINPITLENIDDKKFRILFQIRNLIKKYKIIVTNAQLEKAEIKKSKKIICSNPESMISNYLSAKEFKEINKIEEKTQQQMLEDVKNKKFVLISDKAGSGKSWILKSFTSRLQDMFPNKWTNYVDLKQFIQQFKKQTTELEFATFTAEKILKQKSKYEAEIFKKLYKSGNVCILFDGFDEIAPDCAECVTKLFQSFQQNGGNQVWIATRDYFEVDLKKKLGLDAVYKLDDFTEVHGVELIASSWLLSEMEQGLNILKETDVENHIKTSQNMQEFKKIAENLIKKIPKNQNSTIGLPQFYKMIADITQNNKDASIDFTKFKIFEECVNIQCKRWSHEKGELRTNESIKSHDKELNYQKLHQLVAMKSLFPDETQICDLNIEDLEAWVDEEIIACGMLTKIGEVFLFSHETFREYFVAKFILRILMKPGKIHDDQICEYFIQILTVKKFGIIRMFLNEAFAEKTTLIKIEKKIPKIIEKFCKNVERVENLENIFWENLENLADFLLKVFNNGNYEQIKYILLKNKNILSASRKNKVLLTKVQDFVMNFLNLGNDFRDFMSNNKIFNQISFMDAESIKNFLKATKHKTDFSFVKNSLRMKDENGENLFFNLIRSENFSSEYFQQVIQILKTYFNVDEIIELTQECDKNGWNILLLCVLQKDVSKLEDLWTSLQLLFESRNMLEEFKKLLSQETSEGRNSIIELATACEEINFHETFWRLLLNTFENQEELKDWIMQGDKYRANYIHRLVNSNKPEIIELTIRNIKENFSNDRFEQILKSKGESGLNLLQLAAWTSKDIKTHQLLWKIFREIYKTKDEFLEFLKEVDNDNHNIIHIAAIFTSKDIFEFMINEVEQIATNEEIKNILRTFGMENRNILQSAVMQNESVEFHEYLWKIMRKYFNPQEKLGMIEHPDEYGENLLFYAVECDSKEILEITWKEIKNIFDSNENSSKFLHYLRCVNNDNESIFHILVKSKGSEKINSFWVELKNYLTKDQLKELLSQKTSNSQRNVLHYSAFLKGLEIRETLWKILLNTLENRDELLHLIMQRDKTGHNFVYCLVNCNKADVINFYFKKFKQVFNDDQYEEILYSKVSFNRSLLQFITETHKPLETHQILWKIYQDFYTSEHKFLELIKEVDKNDSNVLHLTAKSSTAEIFNFMIETLEKITSKDEIKNLLTILGHCDENILHAATASNKSLELHQKLWEIVQKYFSYTEVFGMINYCDRDGDNILHNAVYWNIKEIVQFTWNQIKKFIQTKEKQTEYLNRKGHRSHNLLKLSLDNQSKDREVSIWVENMMTEYEINFDQNEDNFLDQQNFNIFNRIIYKVGIIYRYQD